MRFDIGKHPCIMLNTSSRLSYDEVSAGKIREINSKIFSRFRGRFENAYETNSALVTWYPQRLPWLANSGKSSHDPSVAIDPCCRRAPRPRQRPPNTCDHRNPSARK